MSEAGDWVARGLSLVAIFVSVASFVRTGNAAKRQHRIEAGKTISEIEPILRNLEARAQKTEASWLALHAARGMLRSGATEDLKNQIHRRVIEGKKLESRLSDAKKGLTKLGADDLAQRIIQLRSIHVEAEILARWFDAKDQDHKSQTIPR